MKLLILKLIRINGFTLIFLLLVLFCGFIKDCLIIFLIVFLHELGHIFFLKVFNYKIISVTLYPFGGITKSEHLINSNSYKDLLIYFGGILFQILIYIFLIIINKFGLINMYDMSLFLKYNTAIIIFNILPIIPLDGYLIINHLLNYYFNFKLSNKISYLISFIFIVLFIYFNYLLNINNYFIIGLLITKMIEHYKNFKFVYQKFLLERYLYNIPYKKIDKICNLNLDVLKKTHKSLFFLDNSWVDEKVILAKKFDKYQ